MTSSVTMLVATPGGHIDELCELEPRLQDLGPDRVWITAANAQTRRLMRDREVIWVPAVNSRQGLRVARSVPIAIAAVQRHRPSMVVSTGSLMALPYLATAAAARAEVHWIESATRRTGPSTTGRLIQHLPGVSVHHQGFTQPQGRWRPTGNVFDGFRSVEQDPREVRRVVVSVGTERFPFSRIFDCISRAALDHADTVWQTGHTQVSGLPGTARTWIPADELNAAVEAADLVVTHAGVGSVLTALRAGRYPLIFPRLRALGEHIDDHQVELASLLQERGLATVVTSADVDLQAVLEQCARRRIVAVQAAPIRLSAAPTGRP